MKNVKIVIGANFGDEGKGLTTDYFAHKAISNNESCIVVCCNGGAQKGHTVITPDGLRHVTHHYGSGILAGADTYLSEDYIVNPILFRMEREELISKGITPAKVYVSNGCRMTTPYDMLLNQLQEEVRGNGKHGSCGVGIYETICRHSPSYLPYVYTHISQVNLIHLEEKMDILRKEYLPIRMENLRLRNIPQKYYDIIDSDILIDNFCKDVAYFFENAVIIYDEAALLENYDTVIFECSQGLLLDRNNQDYFPHLTPSDTGVVNPMKVIMGLHAGADIEVCYVTRTYVTRHGAGRLETECDKSEIGDSITDLTNVPNPYQDTIRYGKLNIGLLFTTTNNDLRKIPKGINYVASLMLTHINETDGYVISPAGKFEIRDFVKLAGSNFDKVYLSSGMTRNEILI